MFWMLYQTDFRIDETQPAAACGTSTTEQAVHGLGSATVPRVITPSTVRVVNLNLIDSFVVITLSMMVLNGLIPTEARLGIVLLFLPIRWFSVSQL